MIFRGKERGSQEGKIKKSRFILIVVFIRRVLLGGFQKIIRQSVSKQIKSILLYAFIEGKLPNSEEIIHKDKLVIGRRGHWPVLNSVCTTQFHWLPVGTYHLGVYLIPVIVSVVIGYDFLSQEGFVDSGEIGIRIASKHGLRKVYCLLQGNVQLVESNNWVDRWISSQHGIHISESLQKRVLKAEEQLLNCSLHGKASKANFNRHKLDVFLHQSLVLPVIELLKLGLIHKVYVLDHRDIEQLIKRQQVCQLSCIGDLFFIIL